MPTSSSQQPHSPSQPHAAPPAHGGPPGHPASMPPGAPSIHAAHGPQGVDLTAPRAERIAAARKSFDRDPNQMTSVLARQFGLTELEVVQALPSELVTALDVSQWEALIRGFEEAGRVRVILTNASAVLEVEGEFGNFSRTGPFFNVHTPTLDMHIRPDTLGHVFAVEKQGRAADQPIWSFQFFHHEGHAAFKVYFTFGDARPTPELRARWESVRGRFQARK